MPDALSFQHIFEPASDPDAPTLLLLHGTGGDENDLVPLGRAVAPGAGLLSPRGKVLENGAPRFFRRLAEGVFDQQDLAAQTAALASFIEAAARTYHFEPSRLIAVGFSNGANIAASLLLRKPDALSAAALLRPMVPFVPEAPAYLAGKSILVLAAKADPIVPAANTAQLVSLFTDASANVSLHQLPGGHGLTSQDISLTQTWLRQFYQRKVSNRQGSSR